MFPGLNYPYIMKDDQPEEDNKDKDDKNKIVKDINDKD